MLAEVTKDKHDKLSCLSVKDTEIIGSGDIPLESGGINQYEREDSKGVVDLAVFFLQYKSSIGYQ